MPDGHKTSCPCFSRRDVRILRVGVVQDLAVDTVSVLSSGVPHSCLDRDWSILYTPLSFWEPLMDVTCVTVTEDFPMTKLL